MLCSPNLLKANGDWMWGNRELGKRKGCDSESEIPVSPAFINLYRNCLQSPFSRPLFAEQDRIIIQYKMLFSHPYSEFLLFVFNHRKGISWFWLLGTYPQRAQTEIKRHKWLGEKELSPLYVGVHTRSWIASKWQMALLH